MATVISFATRERTHTADRTHAHNAGDRAERSHERRTRQLARAWDVAEGSISEELYYHADEIIAIEEAYRKSGANGRAWSS
jgi:hypothetical protein